MKKSFKRIKVFLSLVLSIYERIKRYFDGKNFSNDDLRIIGTVCISLLTLCAVITIQMFNGFQKDVGSLILIILSFTCISSFILATFKNNHFRENDWNWKQNGSLLLIVFIGMLFLSIGLFENLCNKEITFNYLTDGNPVPYNVSMSGKYKNINDNDESVWLITKSNKYYLERVELKPNYSGANYGTWVITKSNIGSKNKEDEGNYFTLGFIVVPKREDIDYLRFALNYREHGNDALPITPHSSKLDNITVFRTYT